MQNGKNTLQETVAQQRIALKQIIEEPLRGAASPAVPHCRYPQPLL